MTIALPREANAEQREAMLLEFIAKEIDPQKHGVVVEWAKAVSPGRMEIANDDGNTVTLDPTKYDKWGLGYSGTGYKGQGKTQVKTAAVYDNPYALCLPVERLSDYVIARPVIGNLERRDACKRQLGRHQHFAGVAHLLLGVERPGWRGC